MDITISVEGVSNGMFPIGKIVEMLYQAIDYLEPRDKADNELRLPIHQTFNEGGASLTLSVARVG